MTDETLNKAIEIRKRIKYNEGELECLDKTIAYVREDGDKVHTSVRNYHFKVDRWIAEGLLHKERERLLAEISKDSAKLEAL